MFEHGRRTVSRDRFTATAVCARAGSPPICLRSTEGCANAASTSKVKKHAPYLAFISFITVRQHWRVLQGKRRLKVYHLAASSIAIPSTGVLEMCDVISQHSFMAASYIGVTGAAVLSIASIPFKNVIGFLYISEDNEQIKISSVDFWGKRVDRIIDTEDWIPIFDMPAKRMDALYLSPKLTDNTKYKLFVKFGNVINSQKMSAVLE